MPEISPEDPYFIRWVNQNLILRDLLLTDPILKKDFENTNVVIANLQMYKTIYLQLESNKDGREILEKIALDKKSEPLRKRYGLGAVTLYMAPDKTP